MLTEEDRPAVLMNENGTRELRIDKKKVKYVGAAGPVYARQRGRPKKPETVSQGRGVRISPEKKVEAVTLWCLLGNLRTVANTMGINYETIKDWKSQPWWNDVARTVKEESDEEIDSKLGGLIKKSLLAIEDRLEHGDFVVTRQNDIIRKQISAADSLKILSTSFDKRQLLRGKATSISENLSTDDKLKKIADKLATFSNVKTINNDTGDIE